MTSIKDVDPGSGASTCWADIDSEWTVGAALNALRRGCWIEPGGPSGYLLIDPKYGFVVLLPEFYLRRKKYFRLEWWRAGWGKNIKRTSKCRYVYDPPNAEITGPAPEVNDEHYRRFAAGSGESACWADAQSAGDIK